MSSVSLIGVMDEWTASLRNYTEKDGSLGKPFSRTQKLCMRFYLSLLLTELSSTLSLLRDLHIST